MALKQVHDHLVYRYGPLFGKIDRGLTSGIELHYVASDPTRIFRETALPLMTGAPPARYTEDRRRFVPGFGDGASGGAGRLGPFEDTTDADSLAWRDLSIREYFRKRWGRRSGDTSLPSSETEMATYTSSTDDHAGTVAGGSSGV